MFANRAPQGPQDRHWRVLCELSTGQRRLPLRIRLGLVLVRAGLRLAPLSPDVLTG
jgi:hypothetical protein